MVKINPEKKTEYTYKSNCLMQYFKRFVKLIKAIFFNSGPKSSSMKGKSTSKSYKSQSKTKAAKVGKIVEKSELTLEQKKAIVRKKAEIEAKEYVRGMTRQELKNYIEELTSYQALKENERSAAEEDYIEGKISLNERDEIVEGCNLDWESCKVRKDVAQLASNKEKHK